MNKLYWHELFLSKICSIMQHSRFLKYNNKDGYKYEILYHFEIFQ